MGKGLIVYSSRTGNTKQVARGIHRVLQDTAELHPVESAPDSGDFDWILVGCWVDRGTADKKAREYLEAIKGKPVGFFATLGAYPDSDHAKEVAAKVSELIRKQNQYLGSFLCQGRIDPELTRKFYEFPQQHAHAMTPERIKRHQEAARHPDEADIARAQQACCEMLSVLQEG